MSIERVLGDLRRNGWSVAVHNDYTIVGCQMTFWLFTHKTAGLFIKGEGQTDIDALMECERQARLIFAPSPDAPDAPEAIACAVCGRICVWAEAEEGQS